MLTGGCDDLPSQTQSVKGMVNLAALQWLYYKVITTAIVMDNMQWVRSRIIEENGIHRGMCWGRLNLWPPLWSNQAVHYP